jgi:hypothetical protein
MRGLLVSPLVVALAACGGSPGSGTDGGGDSSGGPGTGGGGSSTGGGEVSTGGDPPTTATTSTTGADGPALTYWRDIKAILDAKCAGCHRPGDVAPFSLQTYDEARTMGPVYAPFVADRTMPPWPPDAACNAYEHDRSLTDAERAAVLAWVEDGAPEGDPADEPAAPPTDDPAIDYDIEVGIPEPFTPTALPDDYRCFLLDWPKTEDTYATAFTIEPGARPIVHHVIAFLIPPKDAAEFEALDAADPGPGYPCYGGPGGEASPRARWLGAWVPGVRGGGAMPEGTGIRVQPGSKIALQMHYHPLSEPMADQSTVRIRTAATVERPSYLLPIAHPGWMVDLPAMTIPAGDPDVVHSFEIDVGSILGYLYGGSPPGVGVPVLAHAAGVHMHTRGVRATLTVERGGGGSDCLLDVPRWDFNWQGQYELAAPVPIDPTDQVRIECHFDNSQGDAPMKWGEGTEDEMCLGIFYVSAPGE